ncbi:MAG: aldehyde dehydrogenase family protein [Phycisphaerales bacterium]|nr:aldehyde dehydrogenase family protein [Phycisphaerales bacterium]
MPTSDGDSPRLSNGSATNAIAVREPARVIPAPSPHALEFASAWDYAPAPEATKVDIAKRYGLFINGEFVEPHADKPDKKNAANPSATPAKRELYFKTINPATEQTLSEIASAGVGDVDRAVQAARKAQPKWAALKPIERAKYLFRIARRVQERARELAILETLDGGKPIRESRDIDIPLVAQHFFYHAGWADKLAYAFPGSGGSLVPSDRASTRRGPAGHPLPLGVCGQIIPWNFPLLMAAWKIAPALACGNTVVLKPAETTSLTALRLAEILQEIDLPPGVVNIITGAGDTGAAIVNHPGIDKIAFTGSTDVGKRIAKAIAGTPKKLTLELGGKSPHIIFEDASIDQAVEGIIQGIFFNQGHVCCAGSRLLVQESVLDEVKHKLLVRMASIRVGDPMDKNTDLGAVNSQSQLKRIEGYIDAGRTEGAELHIAGTLGKSPQKRLDSAHASASGGTGVPPVSGPLSSSNPFPDSPGFWCRPCLFAGVQPSHIIAREEIFGPVVAMMSFRTPEEAITRANNTPYGLAAGVWTDKGSKIFEIAKKLEAGVVWLNTYNRFDPASPFGGFKESGFGREGGMQGLRAYVRL